mmetsp:Transcript_43423/g.123005  ORF Transcript_43423/g.123005 Transcript_43423/m.123005 type:complete len:237 (-) Transcript_43423:469-1179(-)
MAKCRHRAAVCRTLRRLGVVACAQETLLEDVPAGRARLTRDDLQEHPILGQAVQHPLEVVDLHDLSDGLARRSTPPGSALVACQLLRDVIRLQLEVVVRPDVPCLLMHPPWVVVADQLQPQPAPVALLVVLDAQQDLLCLARWPCRPHDGLAEVEGQLLLPLPCPLVLPDLLVGGLRLRQQSLRVQCRIVGLVQTPEWLPMLVIAVELEQHIPHTRTPSVSHLLQDLSQLLAGEGQ